MRRIMVFCNVLALCILSLFLLGNTCAFAEETILIGSAVVTSSPDGFFLTLSDGTVLRFSIIYPKGDSLDHQYYDALTVDAASFARKMLIAFTDLSADETDSLSIVQQGEIIYGILDTFNSRGINVADIVDLMNIAGEFHEISNNDTQQVVNADDETQQVENTDPVPDDSYRLYSSDEYKQYRNADNTIQLTKMNGPLGIAEAVNLVVNPDNEDELYSLHREHLLISKDGGESWYNIDTIPLNRGFFPTVVAINPIDFNNIIIGYSDNAYHDAAISISNDGGFSYSSIILPFEGMKIVSDIAIDPNDGSHVLACVSEENRGEEKIAPGILIESNDGGYTWRQVEFEGSAGAQNIEFLDDNSMLMTTSSGIYRADNGAAWASAYSANMDYAAIRKVKGNQAGILAVTYGPNMSQCALLVSYDNGRTWTKEATNIESMDFGLYIYEGQITLFVPKYPYGINRSGDMGKSWELFESPYYGTNQIEILSDGSLLVSTFGGGGVIRLNRDMSEWELLTYDIAEHRIDAIFFSQDDGHMVVAASEGPLTLTYDNGVSWEYCGGTIQYSDEKIMIKASPFDPSTLYAIAYSVGLFKSADGGKTFYSLTSPGYFNENPIEGKYPDWIDSLNYYPHDEYDYCWDFLVSSDAEGKMFFAINDCLYMSINEGKNLHYLGQVAGADDTYELYNQIHVMSFANDGKYVLAMSYNSLSRFDTKTGELADITPASFRPRNIFIINETEILVVAIKEDGSHYSILRSNDFGESWQEESANIQSSPFEHRNKVLDPDNPDIMYVINEHEYMQAFQRQGEMWQETKLYYSLDKRINVHQVVYNAWDGNIYIGTINNGLFYFRLEDIRKLLDH